MSKMDVMPAEHGEMLRAWRALKDAFDPNGIMNPGKLFPDVGHGTMPSADEPASGRGDDDDDATGADGGRA